MPNLKNVKKLLWCVEPIPKDPKLEKSSAGTIKHIANLLQASVTPISYIYNSNPKTNEQLTKAEKKFKHPNSNTSGGSLF